MFVKKPIFILGAPRSGTTWLGRVLELHPDISYWEEINNIWMWGNSRRPDDVLTATDVNPRIRSYIEQKFTQRLRKYGGERICDKTPRNCLRIPFIYEIFPDAKVIMLIRDPRAVINSTSKELEPAKTSKIPWGEIVYRLKAVPVWEWPMFLPRLADRLKKLLGMRLDYWGSRPPHWQDWIAQYPPHLLLAKQWSATMEIAIQEGRKLPADNYLEITYEDIMRSPEAAINNIVDFTELRSCQQVIDFALQTADPSRIDKWQHSLNKEIWQEMEPIIKPTMSKLGYFF